MQRKWHRFDDRCIRPIRIDRRVELAHLTLSDKAVKFYSKEKHLSVNGLLQCASLTPGQQTLLTICVDNPKGLLIKQLEVSLIHRFEIEGCRRRVQLLRFSVDQFTNVNWKHVEANCPLIIPPFLSPSFSYTGRITNSSLQSSYQVHLQVQLKPLFSNVDLELPLFIATHHSSRRSSSFSWPDTIDLTTDKGTSSTFANLSHWQCNWSTNCLSSSARPHSKRKIFSCLIVAIFRFLPWFLNEVQFTDLPTVDCSSCSRWQGQSFSLSLSLGTRAKETLTWGWSSLCQPNCRATRSNHWTKFHFNRHEFYLRRLNRFALFPVRVALTWMSKETFQSVIWRRAAWQLSAEDISHWSSY